MNRHLPRSLQIGAGAACVAACCAAACTQEPPAEGTAVPIVRATTTPVRTGPFRETLTAIGTVVPRPGAVASFSAPTATRVAAVFVVVGQRVAAGDPLVAFERAPLDARAASAGAALQAAEHAAERAQRLVADGILARKDLEQAAADLARARADAIEARRIAQLAQIDAPIAGVITRVNAVLGASVDQGQALVEVTDPTAADVVAVVTPQEAGRIRIGARVDLSSGAAADGASLGTAVVRDVGGAVDPDTRGVIVRISGMRPTRAVRIGESVMAQVTTGEYANALMVPLAALVPDGEGYRVFVVDTGGVAHAQPVTLGGRTSTAARVVRGLAPGQVIVLDGAFGMTDGAQVAPPAGAAPRP